jgi:hypothetical protein
MVREFTENELWSLELRLKSGAPMRIDDLQDLIDTVRAAKEDGDDPAFCPECGEPL